VARRACLERVGGFDESLPAHEDWDLWLRVARHASFAFTDRVLARFRWHAENLTGPGRADAARLLEARVRVLDRFFAAPDMPPRALGMRPVAYRNSTSAPGSCTSAGATPCAGSVRPGAGERREPVLHHRPHRLVHARLGVPEPPRLGPPPVDWQRLRGRWRMRSRRRDPLQPAPSSRGRLERAVEAIGMGGAAGGTHPVEHILSVDTDDDVAGYDRVAGRGGGSS
jgi:hypothetical protein